MSDVRYAVRSLMRSPSFTLVAVLTLALGIGATTAIFSLFDAVVLKSLPVKNPDELYIASAGHYPLYQALRSEADLFSDVLASGSIEDLDTIIDNGMPEKARVSLVSASYFSTLGVPAVMGRAFGAGDDRPAGEPPSPFSVMRTGSAGSRAIPMSSGESCVSEACPSLSSVSPRPGSSEKKWAHRPISGCHSRCGGRSFPAAIF